LHIDDALKLPNHSRDLDGTFTNARTLTGPLPDAKTLTASGRGRKQRLPAS